MKKIFLILIFQIYYCGYGQKAEVKFLDHVNPNKEQPNTDFLMKGISSSSYIIGAALPISYFGVGVFSKEKAIRRKSYQMAFGLGLGMAVSYGLKYTVDRVRPAEVYKSVFPKLNKDSPSFPSGHTTCAFETATMVSLHHPKWYVIVPSYLWASSVGYSRMYLGIHYPSDIFVGAIIGAGSAWLTYKVNRAIMKKAK